MDQALKGFLQTWALSLLLCIATVAIFNATMDPYLLFDMSRIERLNARKSTGASREQVLKAYDVLRERPNVLLLGSSRVDLGLEAKHPAWKAKGQIAYNLGLIGGSPYMARRYLDHVTSQHSVEVVVLGLDFEYFLAGAEPDRSLDDAFEQRLATQDDGSTNTRRRRQSMLDQLGAVFSLTALRDSSSALISNILDEPTDVILGDVDAGLQEASDRLGGAYALFVVNDRYVLRQYADRKVDGQAMVEVRSIIERCDALGVRLVLVINPMHADMLEMLDMLGYWPAIERWKRDLVSVASPEKARSNDRHQVELWDFAGYDMYTTESISLGGPQPHWFWESFHYTRALGDAMTKAITGASPRDFGVLLTRDNIEQRLNFIRERQHQYRLEQPSDAKRVRDICAAVASESPTLNYLCRPPAETNSSPSAGTD